MNRLILIILFIGLPCMLLASQTPLPVTHKDSLALPNPKSKIRLDTPYVKTYVMAMPSNDSWTDKFINLLIGVIGVITGAILSYYYTLQKGKQDTTFTLYHEFNSVEMSKIRHDAWELIKKYPEADMDKILELHVDEGNLLLIIARFYQKLYFNMANKRVTDKLIFELFGDIFYLWYYGFFEKKLVPLNWQNGKNLKKLAELMKTRLPANEHNALVRAKEKQAAKEFKITPPTPENHEL